MVATVNYGTDSLTGKCTGATYINIKSELMNAYNASSSDDVTLTLTIAVNCDTECTVSLTKANLTNFITGNSFWGWDPDNTVGYIDDNIWGYESNEIAAPSEYNITSEDISSCIQVGSTFGFSFWGSAGGTTDAVGYADDNIWGYEGAAYIPDGVYSLTLTYVDQNGTTHTEYACAFVDCKISCQILDHLDLEPESPVVGWYLLLQRAMNVCDDCNCEGACVIYSKIREVIDNPDTSYGCGCK